MNKLQQETYTSTAKIWKDELGIFHKEYLPGAYVDVADLKENRETLHRLNDTGSPALLLIDGRQMKGYSPDARALTSAKEMSKYYKAAAGIVGNPLTRVIAGFFLGINKPAYPVKMFTKEQDAIKWLLSFRS